jgi:subtilisin family serine protease
MIMKTDLLMRLLILAGVTLLISSLCLGQKAHIESRPTRNFQNLPPDGYETGKLVIKIKPEYMQQINEFTMDKQDESDTDMIRFARICAKYKAHNLKPYFDDLYKSNYSAEKKRKQHMKWGLHHWYVMEIDTGLEKIHKIIDEFQATGIIEIAEPILKKYSHGSDFQPIILTESLKETLSRINPSDPAFVDQWHYHNTGQHGGTEGADIDLAQAWEVEYGNDEVIVAIIDGGIDFNHEDLAGNMWENIGYNFVNQSSNISPHNHGTHVAGTIAAVTNNSIGVSGIAGGTGKSDGVRLMSCQVFSYDSNGGFHLAPVYAADNGASISQNSWGYVYEGFFEQVVLDAIDYFNYYGGGGALIGGVTIFSAGNSNSEGLFYPGCYEGCFSVAATNNNDQKSWYSNYDRWIDIAAPGGETNEVTQRGVLSTLNNQNYGFYQGTSMAAPHVSGVAALIISSNIGAYNNDDLVEVIQNTSDDISSQNPQYIGKLGSGRINAYSALALGNNNAPSNLKAFPGNELVRLIWNKPAAEESKILGYNIYRNDTLINSSFHQDTTYIDNQLENFVTYKYYVRTVFEENESVKSNIVFVTPNTGYAGGTGTADDPYLIETAEQLNNVRYSLASHFKQIALINLNTPPWNLEEGWKPIGSEADPFSGQYNGNGNVINGLFINRPNDDHAGLFSVLSGSIANLGITDFYISANELAGALCGKNENADITTCFSSGEIHSTGISGGICGMNSGNINNCYSAVQIVSEYLAGGLCGINSGTIHSSYAVGFNTTNEQSGGLVALENNGLTHYSYWNTETTAQVTSNGGFPYNTLQMTDESSFSDWDFNNTWIIQHNITYPYLKWQETPEHFNFPPDYCPPSFLESLSLNDSIALSWQAPSIGNPIGYNLYRQHIKINEDLITDTSFIDKDLIGYISYQYYVKALYSPDQESNASNSTYNSVPKFEGGSGSEEDPYLISNPFQLNAVRLFPSNHFRLINDLNLGVDPWSGQEGWEPIGTESLPFRGGFDGGGYSIYNLTIRRPNENHVGLFGYLWNATIKNLYISNPYVSGYYMVGSALGKAYSNSVFENIHVKDAFIKLTNTYAGGLMGGMDDCSVYFCSSSGTVVTDESISQWNRIGGLIGGISSTTTNQGNLIDQCYTTANVRSWNHNTYGGLLGVVWRKSTISNCYSRGSIVGTNSFAGGFLGEIGPNNAGVNIYNCYSTGEVQAPGLSVRGFIGQSSIGSYTNNFWDIETSGISAPQPEAEGKTTVQMKNINTFLDAEWDFNSIWSIDINDSLNDGYPILQWQLNQYNCPNPTNITIDSISTNKASVSWENTNEDYQWELLYGYAGFDPQSEGTLISTLEASIYHFTGLEDGTTYSFFVRTICDIEKSIWVGPNTFKTTKEFQVTGGGQYCEGQGQSNVSVVLNGSENNLRYQLMRNQSNFGAPKTGTGGMLIWHNQPAGIYEIFGYGENEHAFMNGQAEITYYDPTLITFTPTFDTACVNSLPIPLSGGFPQGGQYFGNWVAFNLFIPTAAGVGNHEIGYYYTDENGCTDSAYYTVYVDECLDIIESENYENLKVYPVPTNDIINIDISNAILNSLNSIEILNPAGLSLYKFSGPFDSKLVIDLTHFPKGIYILRINTNSTQITRKVITNGIN